MTEIIRHRKHKTMHGTVKHNRMLYFGGHAANGLPKGMADQPREVSAKLDTFVAQLGSDETKILAARIHLSDMSYKGEMNKAWRECIPTDYLASWATIGVASLGDPTRLT